MVWEGSLEDFLELNWVQRRSLLGGKGEGIGGRGCTKWVGWGGGALRLVPWAGQQVHERDGRWPATPWQKTICLFIL